MSCHPTSAFAVIPQPASDRAASRLPPTARVALCAAGRPVDPRRMAPDAPVSTDVALADWSMLMSAVKGRLDSLANPSQSEGRPCAVSQALMAEGVRQCVTALDQLQATLVRELARRPRLELEVFDLQTGLSQARAELIGTTRVVERQAHRQAHHQALHDGLTALPTRRHFRDQLNLALSRSLAKPSPLAVFVLDMNDFKQVNARHGQAVGSDL